MINLIRNGVYYVNGRLTDGKCAEIQGVSGQKAANAYKGTIAYKILAAHNDGQTEKNLPLKLRFDAMASHDITYVGIIQTAKASGLEKFPVPYVLTNCHNSLCAVGGTINEDDHVFGLSAAKKYGGIYVPAHEAVIHTYMREEMSGAGKMILGSDSHTRYGALGTMAVGEGGPELVKQLLCRTYDINYPEIIAVELKGKPRRGVGPQDIALAIIGAVFKNGFVKNKVLEFIGEGIYSLPVEYRNGIDVMTTETACLSSVWVTDGKVKEYYAARGRSDDYKELKPDGTAYYDGAVIVDLDKAEPQIAMPFHPSNVYNLKDVINNPGDIFNIVEKEGRELLPDGAKFNLHDKIADGRVRVDQGVIAGCAGGTYDNIYEASEIMRGANLGAGAFNLSVYPSSQPIYYDLINKGALARLIEAGAVIKTAFCGPCFGAGDVPCNNGFSIRHTTRNFESREGSKPGAGQVASVALMDARSIAASAKNGGYLASAAEADYDGNVPIFAYNREIYKSRVYNGWGKADAAHELIYGPNIKDWPSVIGLTDNLIIELAAAIHDPVTTTDELIPSGETSSYRSNPMKLAEFALSRKAPEYVQKAKDIFAAETARRENGGLGKYEDIIKSHGIILEGETSVGSGVYAKKPGDGSAREQAASCQRVLGGVCNIAKEYATKRYRSNLINWGMIPFLSDAEFSAGDIIFVRGIKKALVNGKKTFDATVIGKDGKKNIKLSIDTLTGDEIRVIESGCLMNYYKDSKR